MEERNYCVVFVCTKKTGGYEGVMTFTAFKNKEEFDKWYTDELKSFEKVVKEGITAEEASKICQRTPIRCRFNAAIQEATDSETGEINKEILKMELANIGILISMK